MKYLIDTDWIIHHLRGNRVVTRKIETFLPDGIAVSIVSLAELYEGIANSRDPHGDEDRLLQFLGLFEILPVNDAICKSFGQHRAALRRQGNLFGDLDLIIACTAEHHALTMLTNNRQHFERLPGIPIETAY